MSFQRYAALQVLSAQIHQAGQPLLRTAHRHVFSYTPRPGFLYVRSRAISSRTNDNYDTFPADEIKQAWATFKGKPVFVNHHNENHKRARGVIIDAALHEDTNPDGSPDTWVEVLMEVDAIRFPRLAKAVLKGWIDRTSMGTDVQYSLCSVCGNRAETPLDYCAHIPKMKGMKIERRTASGSKERVLVHEICHGLGFFENSLLVEEPADPTAYAFIDGTPDATVASLATTGAKNVWASDAHWAKKHKCKHCGQPIFLISSNLWAHEGSNNPSCSHASNTTATPAAPAAPSAPSTTGTLVFSSYGSPITSITSSGNITWQPVTAATGLCLVDHPVMPNVRCDRKPGHALPHECYTAKGLKQWGHPPVDRSTPPDPYGFEKSWPKGASLDPLVAFWTQANQYHPNVNHYQSGGMGHLDGDSTKSVVGFVPTEALRKYQEHDGQQNSNIPGYDDGIINSIADDIKSGKGLTNPIMVEYSLKDNWAFIGEGNHRLEAARRAGVPEVPVRVVRSFGPARRKENGIGAELKLKEGHGWTSGMGDPYTPTDMHPDHFDWDGKHTASLDPLVAFWTQGADVRDGPAMGENFEQFPGSRILSVPGGQLQYSVGNEADSQGATIHAVYVEPEYRRQGVATQLLDALAQKFRHHAVDPGGFTDDGLPLWESWINANGWVEINFIAWMETEDEFDVEGSLKKSAEKPRDTPATHYGLAWADGNENNADVAKWRDWNGWESLPVTNFSLKQPLNATEKMLKSYHVNKVVSGEVPLREGYDPNILIDKGGNAWVADGHHRAAMHTGLGHDSMPAHVLDLRTHTEASLDPLVAFWMEAAGPRYKNAADHPFFQANPVSALNIINHWKRATADDKEQGARWYEDAHTVAKAIANGDAHKGAGVLAAYSPQTLWPVNMFNAARALKSKVAIGGPGSGVFATNQQKAAVQQIIDGAKHTDVLKGPKIRDFAHLIEFGGDQDPNVPHAVIDRHAMSVAAGRRLTDAEMEKAPVSTPHYYNHVVNAYKEAADILTKKEGRPIYPHQVQATTWLVRQRENALEDAKDDENLDRGRAVVRDNSTNVWDDYAAEHFPNLVDPAHFNRAASKIVAIRKNAFGETMAPAEVDTLRPDACPVCGENDSFDGDECEVCGYIMPPDQFADPDLDVARETDLRQDVAQGEDAGDALGLDGVTDQGLPVLSCDTCGAEHQGDLPQADDVTGEDPPADSALSTAPGQPAPQKGNAGKPDPAPAGVPHDKALPPKKDADPDAEKKENPAAPKPKSDKDSEVKAADPAAPKDKHDPKSDPDKDPKIEDKGEIPANEGTGLKAGDTCPSCGKGTLVEKSDAPDEAAEDGDDEDVDKTGDDDKKDDSKKDPAKGNPFATKDKKASVIRARSRHVGSHEGTDVMRPILEVVKRQQAMIESLTKTCKLMQAQLALVGQTAGLEGHFAAMRKRADIDNPAQPIVEPAAEAPPQTTQEARAPETTDSVDAVGDTPGANSEVAPDASTTVDTVGGVVLPPTEAIPQDVTAPVAGTDTLGDGDGGKVYPQITTPDPAAHTEVAFPWTIGSKVDPQARFVAALRLVKLRNATAGIEGADEISEAQGVADDASISNEALKVEIETLARVQTAAGRQAPRNLVPQKAANVQRVVPSFGGQQTTASAAIDDSDLFT